MKAVASLCCFAAVLSAFVVRADAAWTRVAAADSRAEARAEADFVCTGTNDESTIQQAIDACRVNGRQLFFFAGLYHLDSVRDFGAGTAAAALPGCCLPKCGPRHIRAKIALQLYSFLKSKGLGS